MPAAVLVDDDSAIVNLVTGLLNSAGFDVTCLGDGESAIPFIRETHTDVIVLDHELPGISGLETCRRLREFTDAYVIMLSGRDAEVDKVVALSTGADDYVTKPFSPAEFITRVQALMRRPRVTTSSGTPAAEDVVIRIADEERRLYVQDQPVVVTPTEFALVQALAAHAPDPVSRVDLAETVWGRRTGLHVLDVHLSNIRRKLRDAGANPNCIQTERDAALRWRENLPSQPTTQVADSLGN